MCWMRRASWLLTENGGTDMPKYVIEREIPGAGNLTPQELQGISQKSCSVLQNLGPQIQWVQSYVTDDKVYCVYIAPSEDMIRTHAQQGGFPANKISEIKTVIDPTTAESLSVFGFQFTELARWRRLLKTENSKLDTGEVMATEVVMPQMGESIAEGTITKWLKNVGDKVERDEPLFEISTDKVDAEIPSPSAGTLTEIKHKEGETV